MVRGRRSLPFRLPFDTCRCPSTVDLDQSKGHPPTDRLPELVLAHRSGAATNHDDAGIAAMVIGPRKRKVNRTSRFSTSACATSTFPIFPAAARSAHLHPVHREP
jgi:hypothetical protein